MEQEEVHVYGYTLSKQSESAVYGGESRMSKAEVVMFFYPSNPRRRLKGGGKLNTQCIPPFQPPVERLGATTSPSPPGSIAPCHQAVVLFVGFAF